MSSYADYIKFKTLTYDLKNQREIPPVLSSNYYTLYKGYSIVNEKNVLSPPFPMCKGTNMRGNRILLTHSLFNIDEIPKYVKGFDNTPKYKKKCAPACKLKN